MYQMGLSHNNLSALDLTPVKSTLSVLSITNNNFTFATLPVPADYPDITSYFYGNQPDLEAEIVDMKVDLSSQAVAGGANTVYRWFLDGFTFNSDTGEAEGEELIADDEFFVENGVTTFDAKYSKPVQALLTNDAFPNLYLKTNLLYFPTAIQAVEADGGDVNAPVNVYNLQGILVRQNVLRPRLLTALPRHLYRSRQESAQKLTSIRIRLVIPRGRIGFFRCALIRINLPRRQHRRKSVFQQEAPACCHISEPKSPVAKSFNENFPTTFARSLENPYLCALIARCRQQPAPSPHKEYK